MTAKEKREARAARRENATNQARDAGAPTSAEVLNASAVIHPDKVASAAGEIAKPASAGAKVVVACKIGVAYIDLQLSKLEEVQENTQTGPRTVRQARRVGQVVRIRGTAYPRGTPPEGFPEKPKIVDGAALTYGVDKDFWDEWAKQNELNPIVKNRMIFAGAEDQVAGIAREVKDVVSGFDPVDPRGDARMPKSQNAAVSNIETEESRRAKLERAAGAAAR